MTVSYVWCYEAAPTLNWQPVPNLALSRRMPRYSREARDS